MVTDPTGTPLNVRRFGGKVLGALHNGEIVKILRTGADRNGNPGPMSPMRQTEKVGLIGGSSAATERTVGGPEAPTSVGHCKIERQVGKMLSPTSA